MSLIEADTSCSLHGFSADFAQVLIPHRASLKLQLPAQYRDCAVQGGSAY